MAMGQMIQQGVGSTAKMGNQTFQSIADITDQYQQYKESKFNANQLRQQAADLTQMTGSQVNQIRTAGRQVAGEQSAAIAESGTGFGGTNALLERVSQVNNAMDAATANYNGQLQISNAMTQARMWDRRAKNQKPGIMTYLGHISKIGAAGVS